MDENGSFTDQGYVRDTGDSFHEYYDGERGSIPDEYRVMAFQDDLPEEEKSEWAMDIAFDMDEFFRQNDPQYAAEHPEAHAAKEVLYENLMAGRISALEERLAALGQTQEDYLPSEIEKFKDATGYEEFLDFDPAEVKAALEDPNRSRVDEMLAAAEKAEREYAAEAAAYVQTPAAIVEQARAVRDEPVGSFSIYQLKGGNETLDYRFEPLDSIHRNGLSVKPENYELVYEAPLTTKDNLESIYSPAPRSLRRRSGRCSTAARPTPPAGWSCGKSLLRPRLLSWGSPPSKSFVSSLYLTFRQKPRGKRRSRQKVCP